jgi:DNA-binding NarL/FixJ family response regulator
VRVLVVDDSVAVRTRLVDLLAEQAGVGAVEGTGDAADAIERIRSTRPDIVVLDVHLRDSNGLTVLAAFERAAHRPCFVVLTNDASEHYRRAARNRGADYFLDKSSEFERVVAIVKDQIAAR